MAKILTITELRKMQEPDILREINQQYRSLAKLKLSVKGGKEKAHHHLKYQGRQLARMLTVLSELRKTSTEARIPVPTT